MSAKQEEPFQITVNEGRTIEFTPDAATQMDIHVDQDGTMHILKDGKKYEATIIGTNYAERSFEIKINGTKFKLHIADRYERLIKTMGLQTGGSSKINEIKAPMPGLVIGIMVTPGQVIKKGDPLLILEAMKMENVLKSAGDGIVKSIEVTQGAPVHKGTILIRFE
jgi:biotin carboxyl carrier protein